MIPLIALIALTLFMWAVAVWATFEDEQEEPTEDEQEKPTQRDAEQPPDRSKNMRNAA